MACQAAPKGILPGNPDRSGPIQELKLARDSGQIRLLVQIRILRQYSGDALEEAGAARPNDPQAERQPGRHTQSRW